MTIYDKVIAAKDYSKAMKYLVIATAAQFEKCKPISNNDLKYNVGYELISIKHLV